MAIKPFTIGNVAVKNDEPEGIILDFTKSIDSPVFVPEEKKKRGRPRNNSGTTAEASSPLFVNAPHMNTSYVEVAGNENKSDRELSFLESNEPYEKKFQETTNILRSAIVQIDVGMTELKQDIEDIRHSKTMRNKYTYLSNLQQSMGNMIANKISAARELNNTISKCQDLEMKRYKEVKAISAADNQNDDIKVMEMYKAFVNAPVNTSPLPNISQTAVAGSVAPNSMSIGNMDAAYANYVNNLTPAQNMMYLESNPNVKQVVVYNHETGARYFEIMDMSTGQVIPNAEKHDSMFLEDVDIDFKNKVARNVNIGETYPLVEVGKQILNEY